MEIIPEKRLIKYITSIDVNGIFVLFFRNRRLGHGHPTVFSADNPIGQRPYVTRFADRHNLLFATRTVPPFRHSSNV